jgi:hypothetical protein
MAKINLIDLYKSLHDKPLQREQFDPGNRTAGSYDPGNEPLEIQYHEDQQLYYIEPEDIEAYVSGETVFATDPDRGMDDVEVNRENSDVTGVNEDELEDFIASSRGDQSTDDVDDDDRFMGMDDIFGADLEEQPRPDYADVDGDGDEEESMEKAFKDKEKMDEQGCSEQEIEEGTCGYSEDGKPRKKPAGPNLMGYKKLQERFKKLANIKK